MTDLLTIRLDPADSMRVLDLIDTRIRSERARISAFRARDDTGNEIVAAGTRRLLLFVREALVAGAEGASDEG